MSHPIPQELRDRFDQIERDIMGNKMARDAVFTQMRTAVQCYFVDHPVKPPACATCQDNGVIGWTTGQTPESFDQGEAPCPDCQPFPMDCRSSLPKYRAVPTKQLMHILGLIDPPPFTRKEDGATLVFKNPMAAEVLTAISAEVRAMMDEPAPQPVPGVTWEAQGDANMYMLFKDDEWLASVHMNGQYLVAQHELFLNSFAGPHKCTVPPTGWICSRRQGHSGPCAATEDAQRPR
jgi:hypothetical protein